MNWKLEFKPVVRDCPHNHTVQAGEKPLNGSKRLITDFDIFIDGEKRAEFHSAGFEIGYSLHLLTGVKVEIPRRRTPRRPYFRGGERAFKNEFELVVIAALASNQIPSLADQIKWQAEADRIKAEKNEAAWAKYCASYRTHRLSEKADELMHLLTNVDKSSETAWNSWLFRRDQLVEYIQQQPPKDDAHLQAAGIRY